MTNAVVNLGLTFRRAVEADRTALERIAARTWDGTDYLPQVLSDWLHDPAGEFYVAVDRSDRVIGTSRVTRLADGEWWMEGARVDPDSYGQGVGYALLQYGVERAEILAGHDGGMVRFCTAQNNLPVQRMAVRSGFSSAAHFSFYTAQVLQVANNAAMSSQLTVDPFRQLAPDDVPAISTFLSASAHFQHNQRSLVDSHWRCYLITAERLEQWSAAGRVYGWYGLRSEPTTLGGLLITAATRVPAQLNVAYLDASLGNLAVMAQAVRVLAGRLGYDQVWHLLLARPERLVAIEQGGWRQPEKPGGAYLYSRPLGLSIPHGIDP